MDGRRNALIPGIVLVLLGLYFLLGQLNIALPGFGSLWPAMIILGGVLFIGDYAFGRRDDSGKLFTGVAAVLVGAFFFLFTLNIPLAVPGLEDGVQWGDMGRLWPGFVLAGGFAFLAQWGVEPANTNARNSAFISLAVGIVALAINFSSSNGNVWAQIWRLWPLALVFAGLQMLFRYFRRRRTE